jgi:Domain of unknown function (DUF1818)
MNSRDGHDASEQTRLIKSGAGWRLGWDVGAKAFQGLVGTDDWSLELTAMELEDFCRLLAQLDATMTQMQTELMDEEAIAIEAESDLLWLEASGCPQAYHLRLMVLTGRRAEGSWPADVMPALVAAARSLHVF